MFYTLLCSSLLWQIALLPNGTVVYTGRCACVVVVLWLVMRTHSTNVHRVIEGESKSNQLVHFYNFIWAEIMKQINAKVPLWFVLNFLAPSHSALIQNVCIFRVDRHERKVSE